MNLHELKGVHKHVVVGLAGMVQEQTATQLAGMDQAEIYINMQRIWSNIKKMHIACILHTLYAGIAKNARNMQIYRLY